MSSLLALAAFVAAQLGGLAHIAFVRHVTCGEHGELLESTASSPPPAPASPLAAARSAEEAEHTGHDHCAVDSFLHQSSHACALRLPATGVVSVTMVVGLTPAAPPLARAPYRFAPKTSPPA